MRVTRWLLPILVSGTIHAQDIRARASVDSTDYLVGDWISVRVQLSHPPGLRFQPIEKDSLGGFTIIEAHPLEQSGQTETHTRYVVARYDSGDATLLPIRFHYSLSGDTTQRTVATNAIILRVHTVVVDTSQDIKDIKPPLSISLTLLEILLYAAIALALIAAAYFGYRYWKKRRRQSPEQLYVAPQKPAHVIALEQLALLKEKKLWQQGLVKEYYSELTGIVRLYIENRYHLLALEQTTDEILEGLLLFPLPQEVMGECEIMLRQADLVKFAKFQPDIADHERTLKTAYDIVERTRLVAAQSTLHGEVRTEEHAGP